jgi:hypothetical protein
VGNVCKSKLNVGDGRSYIGDCRDDDGASSIPLALDHVHAINLHCGAHRPNASAKKLPRWVSAGRARSVADKPANWGDEFHTIIQR